jgi:hypothetical protein
MKKTPSRPRDPAWRTRRALGHKITADRTRYSRKTKHRKSLRHEDRGGFFVGGGVRPIQRGTAKPRNAVFSWNETRVDCFGRNPACGLR